MVKKRLHRVIVVRGVLLLLYLFGVLFLSGCWDAMELNKRAVVSGIGIDLAEGEEKYLVSLQIIIADEISGKIGRGATPTSVYQAKGKTIVDAIRNSSRKVPRIVSPAQARLIVMSEDVAREGIGGIVDYLDRDSDIRLTANVYVAKKGVSAMDILSALTPIGKISGYAVVQKTDMSSHELGENYSVEVDDVIRGMLVSEGGPVLNGLTIIGDIKKSGEKSNLESSSSPGVAMLYRMAVFKGDKMQLWLTEEECRGLVWIKNKMKKSVIVIQSEKDGEDIAMEVMRSRTRIKASLNDPEHPVIRLNVMTQFSIREVNSKIDLRNPLELETLENKVEQVIQKQMQTMVDKAQSINCDVFTFSEVMERADPAQWTKIKDRWGQIFPKVKVEYHVDAVIRNSQMRDRSFKYYTSSGQE
ncbi:Spore germination protein B3 precursor [compost metagenome]